MFYLKLKEVLAAEDRPQFMVNLSAGTMASVAATLITQPFDVVRWDSLGGASLGVARQQGVDLLHMYAFCLESIQRLRRSVL